MPRPEISPLHLRLRQTAFGLHRRNERVHQHRALADLSWLAAPMSRRKAARVTPGQIAWYYRLLAEIAVAGSGRPERGVFVDREIGGAAGFHLGALTDPVAREAIRQVWLQDPDGTLADIIKDWVLVKDWLLDAPRDKAVTLFLLGAFDQYVAVDPSGELVESARVEGDPVLRVRLATAARRGEQLVWAYRVAAVPERLLPEEWEAVIALLRPERQQYLWQVLGKAPLQWSARCLTELGDWRPADPAAEPLIQLAKRYLAELGASPEQPGPEQVGSVTSPDGTLIAKAKRSGRLLLQQSKPRRRTYVPTRTAGLRKLHTLQFTPDGTLLVAAGWDRDGKSQVAIARAPGGEAIALLTPDNPQGPPQVTPDGTYLVIHEQSGPAVWRLPACTRVDTPLEQLLPTADNAALRAELDAYLRRDRPRDL